MKKIRMNTNARFLSRWAGFLLAGAAALGASCSQDDTQTEDPYIRFGEEITDISYDRKGGSQQIEMYTNLGDWSVETSFTEDEEWLDIWPREGRNSGHFTVTVGENDGAYSRFGTVNVVVGGKSVKSFTVRQASGDVEFALDMGNNSLKASARGSDFTIGLLANVGWKAEAVGSAAGWIELGEATDSTQVVIVKPNEGGERTGEVRFFALGTGLEDFCTTVTVKQFDQAHDPYNGTRLTVAQLKEKLSDGVGRITDNVWIEATVVSDQELLNFESNQMVVQDESGQGILIEFANTKDNLFRRNDKLKLHLYEAEFVQDPVTKGSKLAAFTVNSIFDQSKGSPVEPVETTVAQLDRYENTLVKLPSVEFAVPLGTYYNSQEDQYDQTAASSVNANAEPYNDGHLRYLHILRDGTGSWTRLYTRSHFLERYARIVPKGSCAVTGIVMKYTKNGVTENTLRVRSLGDIQGSDDESTRLTNTLVRFGPFDWNSVPQETVVPNVGRGEIKTTAFRGLQSVQSIALELGYSHIRRDTPGTITVGPNGKQTVTPPENGKENTWPYILARDFWNHTGSTMNRQGSDDPDYKGEAWVFNVTDFASAGGDLWLTFTTACSWYGPLEMRIEWSDDEAAALDEYHAIGDFFSPLWNEGGAFHLRQFTVKLPDELKSKRMFTIRFRATENHRAGANGLAMQSGGYSGIGFWAITEQK